jgi:outer membrane immunogenic protein
MNRAILGFFGVSALLIAAPLSSAGAADMPLKARAAPPPAYSWTGCYIDGGVGYGLWNQDHFVSSPAFASASTTDGGRGWLGRVGGGCDLQFPVSGLGNFVIGAFGDYDFMSLRGTTSPSEFITLGGITSPVASNEKETGAWSVGGRLGYVVTPSTLVFGDGGYTQTRFGSMSEFQTATNVPTGFGYSAQTYRGWFLGGGSETALSSYLSSLPSGLYLRTEYRFSTYQSATLSEFSIATGALDGNILHVTPYVQTVTTSLVWRFPVPGAM